MKRSSLFQTGSYEPIQEKIKSFLNSHQDFLTSSTASSPRASGDAIQEILAANFQDILGSHCSNYSSQFARRAMADLAFEDTDGFYHVVDVKTHRLSTKFNMPNLTSVDRLARFYEDDNNYFDVLMVAYDVEDVRVTVKDVTFVPIEFLDWDILTLGALGWGQIQIANSNVIKVDPGLSRRTWMIQLCDNLLEFYPKEIAKTHKRIDRFKKLRETWVNRSE